MENFFSRFGLDIIGKAVFNYDFDSLTHDDPVIQVRRRPALPDRPAAGSRLASPHGWLSRPPGVGRALTAPACLAAALCLAPLQAVYTTLREAEYRSTYPIAYWNIAPLRCAAAPPSPRSC